MTPVPDRDEALDRILRRFAMSEGPSPDETPVSEDCLDAETVAAMADGGLSPDERSAAAEHALACARCRELLAAVIRTTPEPIPHSSWWQDWLRVPAVRWLAPLAATGLAVAMWVAVANRYPDESSLPVPAAVQETKEADAGRAVQAPPQLAPEAGQGSPTPAAGASAGAIREPSADAKGARDKDAAAAEPELKRSMVAGNLKADPASTRQSEVRKERSDAPARVDELAAAKPKNEVTLDKYAAATPPPVPPPPTPAPAAQSPSSSPVAGARGGNAAAPKAAETALTDRATFRAAPSSAAESVVATVNIASPDSRSRWRITGSTVQRSTDNGGTWTDQDPGVRVRLLAGSAPHPDICWIVGAQGTVLVSVDGKSWQHVKAPDPGSLVSVLATSADAATVTTSDGRTFVTTDRGQTWGTKF